MRILAQRPSRRIHAPARPNTSDKNTPEPVRPPPCGALPNNPSAGPRPGLRCAAPAAHSCASLRPLRAHPGHMPVAICLNARSVKSVDNLPISVDKSPESVDNVLALCPHVLYLSTLPNNPQVLHNGCQQSIDRFSTSYPQPSPCRTPCRNVLILVNLRCACVVISESYPPFPRPYYYFYPSLKSEGLQ